MLTTCRLVLSVVLVTVMAWPGASDEVRIFVGIALVTGLFLVWNETRHDRTQ